MASEQSPAQTPTRRPNIAPFLRLRLWLAERLSIRRRLTLWYALLLVALLALVSSVTFTVAQNQIQSNLNTDIRMRAIAVANALQHAQYTSAGGSTVLPAATATPGIVTATPSAIPTTAPTVVTTPNATPDTKNGATGGAVTPTPVTTPDPATSAAIQKQLTLTVPDVLGRLDLGFEVLDTAGRLKYLAPSLNGQSLPINYAVVNGALRGVPGSYSTAADGVLLAVYAQPIILSTHAGGRAPGVGPTATPSATNAKASSGQVIGVVLVAKSQQDVNNALGTLGRILLVADLVAIVIALLIGWLIVETSLRPIATITRTAHAIARDASAAGLGTRVTYRGAKDEVGELVATFNEMLASLEQVADAQRQFVSDASHELRAPLTTIRGALELLRQPDLTEQDRAEIVDDAYVEAERMSTLVSDLLLLARVDAASASHGARAALLDGQLSGRRDAVEMDEFVMELFRAGQSQLRALRKQTRLAVTDIAPVTVMADPGQLRQLGMILLDNAIKYTPSDGQIRLAVTQAGPNVVLTVSDTGIGISPDDLPHIYKRFWRADRARERDEHGSGLGLAIARWITMAHHGEISVESAPGKGTTFTVTLPAAKRLSEQSGQKVATGRRKRVRRNTLGLDAIKPLARLAQTVSRPRSEVRGLLDDTPRARRWRAKDPARHRDPARKE
ncbi:MAG: HAMP domain-containing histidine kinase [Chloroflexota bacterium]|nr:HAMP domain-containing histidine kinase [Chloroflexota bacterium]